jgi:predicted nuclease with TOPRIM domain
MIKKKSKTQMTKIELIEELKRAESVIKDLETEMETMQKDRIALDTIVTNQETSYLITSLNTRIRELEKQVLRQDKS